VTHATRDEPGVRSHELGLFKRAMLMRAEKNGTAKSKQSVVPSMSYQRLLQKDGPELVIHYFGKRQSEARDARSLG
jgi:hypothetical protein